MSEAAAAERLEQLRDLKEQLAAVRHAIANDPYPVEAFPSYQDHDYVKGWRAAMATVARHIEENRPHPTKADCDHRPCKSWCHANPEERA